MMKKLTEKTGLRTLWLLALLVAMVSVLLVSCGEKNPGNVAASDEYVIAWNVDRDEYLNGKALGTTGRTMRSDGYYYIKFAVEGKQMDFKTADSLLVERIDMLRCMAIKADEDRVIQDVVDVHRYGGGVAIDRFFVMSIDGNKVVCNNASSFEGVTTEITLPEGIGIYYASGSGPLVGMKSNINVDDEITVLQDEQGNYTHVFVRPYEAPGQVYWNLNRMYSSTTGSTTRQSDMLGYYTFELALDGEVVTVKTKSLALAEQMDKNSARCFGLTFDEEGYASTYITAKATTGGGSVSSWYRVTDINGNSFTSKKLSSGSMYDGMLSKYAKVINVSPVGEKGAYTELRYGDEIHCLTDSRGMVCYAFVINRLVEGPIYLNVERQYNSTTKETKRTPDGNGWYYVSLAANGEVKEYRTRSKTVIDKIDASSTRLVAIRTEGDEILEYFAADSVNGGGSFGSWYDIQQITEDGYVTVKRILSGSSQGKEATARMAEDVQIVNATKNFNKYQGEFTELRVGDRIHGMKDINGELKYIIVVNRLEDGPVYWNYERKWNSTKKVSTRERAEDGYFYFNLAVNGQTKVFKTKSQELANKVDSFYCFGLDVSGNTILKYYSASVMKGCDGSVAISWDEVLSVGSKSMKTIKRNTNKADVPHTGDFASDMKIINVSGIYDDHPGEYTKIRVGDKVHCLRDANYKIHYTFVVGRQAVADIAWNVNRQYDSTNKVTKRTPDADGWYYIEVAINGKLVTVKTDDEAMATKFDSNAAKCWGLTFVDNDDEIKTIKNIYACSSVKGYTGGTNGSWVDITGFSEDGKTVYALKADSGTKYTIPIDSKTKIYNVSTIVDKNVGEKTTLRIGDQIHVLADTTKVNGSKRAGMIFVVKRGPENSKTAYCAVCEKDVLWADFNPALGLAGGFHYALTEDVTIDSRLTVSGETTLCLNGHTLTSTERALYVSGNLTIFDSITDASDIGGAVVAAGCTGGESSVASISGKGTLNLYSGTLRMATEAEGRLDTYYGGVLAVYGTFNQYGGTVSGGYVSKTGGNVMANGGTLNLYGGKMEGGHATTNAGNIYARNATVVNIYEGYELVGGTATNGGNLYLNEAGTVLNMFGGKIENGTVYVTATSDVIMTGGSITGGRFYSNNNITLSGDVIIEDLYVVTGKTLTIGDTGMGENSSVTLKVGDADVAFAQSVLDTDVEHFHSGDELYKVVKEDDGALKLQYLKTIDMTHTVDAHCVCVGNGTGKGAHTCDDSVEWIAWGDQAAERTSFPKESGNYYLVTDIVMTDTTTIPGDKEVNVCLNGHTVTGPEAKQLFWVNGTIGITDCAGTGSVISTNGGHTSHFYLQERGIVNLYAGTLDASQAIPTGTSNSGVINMYCDDWGKDGTREPAFLNIYGGTIIARDTAKINKYGSAINVGGYSSEVHMYGGTITGGTVKGYGGVLHSIGTATVELAGGTITGNKAQYGTVYIGSNTTLIVSGDIRIEGNTGLDGTGSSNLFLESGKKMTVGELGQNASIGVKKTNAEVFAQNVTTDPGDKITSDNTERKVAYDETAQTLALESLIVIPPHEHCICGGKTVGVGGHTCDANVTWIAWGDDASEKTTLPKASGNYYLVDDITMGASFGMTHGNTVSLCLNGHTVTGMTNNPIAWFRGTMNITDCAGGGKMIGRNTSNSAVFYMYEKSVLNLYAGVLDGSQAAPGTSTYSYAICMYCDNVDSDTTKTAAYINMYGGQIIGRSDATGAKNAGAVYMSGQSSVFTLYGGTITGGTSARGSAITAMNTNTINLLGGTITGGKSDKGAISTGSYVTINLGGDIQLIGNTTLDGTAPCNIHLADGAKKLVLDGLTAQASVGVTMAEPGLFAENVTGFVEGTIVSDDADYGVTYDETAKTLTLTEGAVTPPTPPAPVAHENHCVCGGSVTVGGHTCDTITDWIAWGDDDAEKTTLPTASGNYYLADDITLSTYVSHTVGTQMTICLNGHNIHQTGNSSVFGAVRGVLNITDCSDDESGSITTVTNGYVGLASIYTGATMNLYAGTLDGSNAPRVAGSSTNSSAMIIMFSEKVNNTRAACFFNMYGGTIIGRDAEVAQKNAGGVVMNGYSSVFTMYGGTITGATAVKGSAVYTTDTSHVKLLGGTITGNTSDNGAVYMTGAKGTLTIGKDMIISGNTTMDGKTEKNVSLLSGAKLILDGVTDDADVGITMEVPGIFAENVETDLTDAFYSDSLDYDVTYDATAKTLSLTAAAHKGHCVCGGAAVGVGDHTECTAIRWQPISEALTAAGQTAETVDFGLIPSGYYYLDTDLVVTGNTNIGTNDGSTTVELNICLNGKKVTTAAAKTFAFLKNGSVINLCDCAYDAGAGTFGGTMEGGNTTYYGGIIYTHANSDVNIYGGNYTAQKDAKAKYGGLFVAANDNAASVASGATSADLAIASEIKLYNGNLTGGETERGGAIYCMHANKFTMYGGKISGGRASVYGGNIYAGSGSEVKLLGGVIENGDSTHATTANSAKGGNIYITGQKTVLTVEGTEIRGGSTSGDGGNLYIYSGKAYLKSGSITGGNAGRYGGNVYAIQSEFHMEGGTVSDGTAGSQGGNIRTGTDSTVGKLFFTGGTVTGGTCPTGKSVYVNGEITVTGAPSINEVYLASGKTVAIGTEGLTTGASVGVNMGAVGAFTGAVATDLSDFFFATNTAWEDAYEGGKMVLKAKTA